MPLSQLKQKIFVLLERFLDGNLKEFNRYGRLMIDLFASDKVVQALFQNLNINAPVVIFDQFEFRKKFLKESSYFVEISKI